MCRHDRESPERVEDLLPGDHLCTIYETEAEHRSVLTDFIRAGLERRERVAYITDARTADDIRSFLREEGLDVARAEADEQLVFLTPEQTYLRESRFDPDAMIALLESETKRALQDGWAALRATGEMTWALREAPGSDRLIEYEARLNDFFEAHASTGLCQYDRRRFGADTLLDVLRTHPIAVIGTDLHQNPYYIPPDEILHGIRPDAQLARWMTSLAERKHWTTSLQASERRFRQLFDSLESGYALHEMIWDHEGKPIDYRFLQVNPAFERLTRLPARDILNRTVTEVMPGIEHLWIERYGNVATTGEPVSFTDFSRDLDRHFEVSAFCPERGRFAVLFHDVTDRVKADDERRRLADQTHESQKLESLGLLAGGIAHDFNNLLVGILGNASLALMDISENHPAAACLRDVELAAQRAAGLAKQLLAYSGRGRFVVEPIDLATLIEEMGHLLEASVPKSISLRFHFEEPLSAVMADASQLRQLVMNLLMNAAQAIGDKSGIITISTSMMDCDKRYLANAFGAAELAEGRYVFLEVSDTGCGMDAETQAKMFDPFYTTKRDGRGLGLSAVLGIMRAHAGAIRVYSEVGRGTTFKLLLPECEEAARESEKRVSIPGTWKASGTVLVVDDEASVRQFARRCLQRFGFDVLTAEDGREGLAIYKTHQDTIKVVLLDMMMPHMGGEKTFTELRRVNPDVRVVLSSGYNEQDAVRRFAGRGLAGFIQKPYQVEKLEEAIRAAIKSGEKA